MKWRDRPVREKLMRIILGVSGSVALLAWASLFTYDYLAFRSNTVQTLVTLGKVVAQNSAAPLAFQDPDDAKSVLEALAAKRNVTGAALYDTSGRIFATYPAGRALASFPARPGPDGYRFGRSQLGGFEAVTQGGARMGTLYLEQNLNAIVNRLWIYAGLIALLAAVSLAVAYTLSNLLQREISEPIQELMASTRAAAGGDLSRRAARRGGDELGHLTDAFNEMLDEIQKLRGNLEQRVADRTAQLESANAELEAFSYSVSHDLRAPLRHIDGFANLLQKHLEGSADETSRRYMETIASSAKRLGTLIDELLVFSRMGRAEMRQDRFEMRELVEEVRRELGGEGAGRRIEWSIGELPPVQGDPAMLRQVWANLLGNALKYTRNRPETRIEIAYRRDPAKGHVFSVRDNGAGFDMKYLDKLFGVFQRLHSAKEFEGTGIGLANVRRIVRRHGGDAWGEGRLGEGAVFYFSLPEKPPPAG